MSIPIKNLDDFSFDDLINEARSLIPVYVPEWTNHNPSEPGITILELFAWLCEMVLYRIDQVTDDNYIKFLKLLGVEVEEGEDLSSAIRRGVGQLTECTRAVTAEDFEKLAYKALMEKTGLIESFPDLKIRTICVPNRDLENSRHDECEQFGHVSIILVARTEKQNEFVKQSENTRKYIKEYLSERKLLTNRVHVVDPDYGAVRINMQVSGKDLKLASTVKSVIENYIDPITGGPDGKGWPLGRNLYRSDLYYLVEGITGINHVIRIELDTPDVKSYQLIRINEINIEVEL